MSDVHGRKRVDSTDEIREKDLVKIKEYNSLVESIEKYKNVSFDDPLDPADAQAALKLTEKILQANPDYYTIWNLRRRLLLSQNTEQIDFKHELALFMQLIRINVKSYWLWNHRCWCLRTMREPKWLEELALVDKMLTLDARNFHGWNYRRYVVKNLSETAQTDEQVNIMLGEYQFTTKKINESFSNYSAWHQRSKLLPGVIASIRSEEKNKLVQEELDMIKNAIYTDPNDQSAWLYYWWLVGRAPEYVHLLGAFRNEGSRVVIVGFSDLVRFVKPPEVLDAGNKFILGKWTPLSESSNTSSIWMFEPDGDGAVSVKVSAESILPCNGAKMMHAFAAARQITAVSGEGDLIDARIAPFQKQSHATHNDQHHSPPQLYSDPVLDSMNSVWHTLDRVDLLNKEIQSVRELLEIEPDSTWALQTLARFLQQLKQSDRRQDPKIIINEIIEIFEKLASIDNYRAGRYKDWSARMIFERFTLELCHMDEETEQLALKALPADALDLRTIPLDVIPVPAFFLLVRRLVVDPTHTILHVANQLPFLTEITNAL